MLAEPAVQATVVVYPPILRLDALTLKLVVLLPTLPVPESAVAVSPMPLPAGMESVQEVGPATPSGAVMVSICDAGLDPPIVALKTNCEGDTDGDVCAGKWLERTKRKEESRALFRNVMSL